MIRSFNCIIYDFNSREFKGYDIMPYLLNIYSRNQEKPKTFEEFKNFILHWSKYQFWARCEYEIILKDWPTGEKEKKIDIYWQITNNIDVITKIFIENLNEKGKKAL